jgi:hypothetical protein
MANETAHGRAAPRRAQRHGWIGPACLALAACLGEGDDPPLDASGGSDAAGASGSRAAGSSGSSGSDSIGAGAPGSAGGDAVAGTGGVTIEAEMPPATGESGIFEGVTAAHNAARQALALPDLSWSSSLAEYAQQWSDTLAAGCSGIRHRTDGSYGENIAVRASRPFRVPFSAEEAVEGWVAEVACWEYGSINRTETCEASCISALNSTGCGHYTQVVWRNTESVGCGYSTCEVDGFTREIWVCNYDPPGNYIGQTPY